MAGYRAETSLSRIMEQLFDCKELAVLFDFDFDHLTGLILALDFVYAVGPFDRFIEFDRWLFGTGRFHRGFRNLFNRDGRLRFGHGPVATNDGEDDQHSKQV